MIALLILLLAAPVIAEDTLADVQVRFGVITGDVGLLPQGAVEWIEPHEGLPIEIGDHIRTGEDGRVEIQSSENALWMLEPESDLVAERENTTIGQFDLSSGTLLGKLDSERTAGTVQKWDFSTPAAVAAIRGTEFALECSKKEGTRLAVFEGDVELEPAETAEGPQPPVEVAVGHEGIVQRNHPVQVVKKFSPRMQTLAAALPAFRRRQRQIQNTWSPFTPEVRTAARQKFVAPPPKPVKRRPPVRRPYQT